MVQVLIDGLIKKGKSWTPVKVWIECPKSSIAFELP